MLCADQEGWDEGVGGTGGGGGLRAGRRVAAGGVGAGWESKNYPKNC